MIALQTDRPLKLLEPSDDLATLRPPVDVVSQKDDTGRSTSRRTIISDRAKGLVEQIKATVYVSHGVMA